MCGCGHRGFTCAGEGILVPWFTEGQDNALCALKPQENVWSAVCFYY